MGDYWTLFASMFVHVDILHLLFNVYWLYVLGGYLEEHYGRRYFTWLALIAGFCGSSLELTLAGSTGVGLSGVVYAIFGVLWGAKLFAGRDVAVLPSKTIRLFLYWFVGCIALTATGLVSVGNVAHGAGLLIGLSASFAEFRSKALARWIVPTLVAFCGLALFWSPWSYLWLASRAMRAHRAGDWLAAESYYSKLIEKDPMSAWALRNRGNIRIYLGHKQEGQADLAHAEQMERENQSGPRN